MTLFLLNVSPFTMNASSWRKAADLVAQVTPANPQVQAAAMAELQQLESLPLSALSVDDSGPPQVTYDSQQPIATSTPRATLTLTSETPTEAYRQIIPGMSDCLYPTLVADGSLSTHVPDNRSMLQNQITSEVDKYRQEVAERCKRDVNYFDRQHMATNTSSQQQKANLSNMMKKRYRSQMAKTPVRMVHRMQNTTFNIMTSWKPFQKKKTKIHKWQQNKMSMI